MDNQDASVKTILTDGILQISLNRPEKLNALNGEVLEKLSRIFTQAKDDDTIRALLITGQGKAFCAGADINRLAEYSAKEGKEFALYGQSVFRQLETLGKPSIAAINGFAFGGGCELAMSAHLRIASDIAKFGQPEVKLGIIPGYGGTQRLARLVGKGRALDLCLTGRFIDAKTAYDWGLVTQLVSTDELIPQATKTLETILSMGPCAIKSVLDVVDRGYDLSLEDALHLEAIHFGLSCATKDKQEGTTAFIEKREPVFIGE